MNVSLCKNTLNTRWVYVNYKKTNTIRSDKLDKCTREEYFMFKSLGIKAIIDLRENSKAKRSPCVVESGLEYYNISIPEGDIYEFYSSIGVNPDVDSRRLAKADYYVNLLDKHIDSIKQVLQIWSQFDGHVVIHCSLGRDRTGIICAIIQSIMGAPHKEIIDEYALSANNLKSLKLEDDKDIDYDVAQTILKDFLQKAKPFLNICSEYVKSIKR